MIIMTTGTPPILSQWMVIKEITPQFQYNNQLIICKKKKIILLHTLKANCPE